MAIFEPTSRKGPAARDNVKYRFLAITRTPTSGVYEALHIDAVTNETLVNKADVPLHPTSRGVSISDHAIVGARAYTLSGFYGNLLKQDNELSSFFKPADGLQVVFRPGQMAEGAAAWREENLSLFLELFLGVPLTIYSPRFGKLQNFALVSYNDNRDQSSRVSVDLSFQELRIASVDEVLVPRIERAKAQATPTDVGQCGLTEEEFEVEDPGFGDSLKTNAESIFDYLRQQAFQQEARLPILHGLEVE